MAPPPLMGIDLLYPETGVNVKSPAGHGKFTDFLQRNRKHHFSEGGNCDKMYKKNYALF